MISEAIILASGKSTRLAAYTHGKPKCFVRLITKPLYHYPLDALLYNNIKNVIIVAPPGYRDEIASQLMNKPIEFRIVENHWIEKGNAFSTLLGLERTETEKALVTCCDTIAPPSIYRKLIEKAETTECDICIAASRNKEYIDYKEATKIIAVGDRVISIDKSLENTEYIDTGIMIMSKKVLELAKVLSDKKENHLYQHVYKALEKGMDIRIVDVGETPWTEIDTPQDIQELLDGKRRTVLEYYWREING